MGMDEQMCLNALTCDLSIGPMTTGVFQTQDIRGTFSVAGFSGCVILRKNASLRSNTIICTPGSIAPQLAENSVGERAC